MQTIIISILLTTGSIHYSMNDVVTEFHKCKTKQSENQFIDKYSTNSSISIKAYVIALKMKQIEYLLNPINKLSQFNKYTDILDVLVTKHPTNIHLRYIRLMIQEKSPSLLGYNESIAKDKKFLTVLLGKKDKSDYLDSHIRENTSL